MMWTCRLVVLVSVLVSLMTGCGFRAPDGAAPDAAVDATVDPPTDTPIDTPPPGAWLQPWLFRKQITLKATQIEAPGDGSLVDFPVLISVSDPQIRNGAASDTGDDIVFTSDDATTVLSSQVESFGRNGNDSLVAWVKVPTLASQADTTLYVYYGNANAPVPTPAQTEAVWTADYLGVWHLQQDPSLGGTGNIQDATSGSRNGTAMQLDANDSVDAKIGRGLNFDGSAEYLNFGGVNVGSNFTISMWVRIADGNNVRSLLANSASGADTDGFRLFVNTVGTENRRIIFETGDGPGGGGGNVGETPENSITQDVFAHVAVVVNRAAGTLKIYVDGQDRTEDGNIRNNFQTNSDFEVGRLEDGLAHFPGTLDEIQLSSVQRTIEWIQTSYNNQSQPSTFHTFGNEERRP